MTLRPQRNMGLSCSKVCQEKSKRYEKKGKKGHREEVDANQHNKQNGHRHRKNPKQRGEGGTDKLKGHAKPRQPVIGESDVNYAINRSDPTENNKGNDDNMKENNFIRPNINGKERVDSDKNKKGNKKARRKRNQKQKRRSYSSDSSWSSSSSSTNSSSEEENRKTTKSRQKKINNDGSVTYVKNKTTFGGSKISFKAANNVNIYKNTYIAQPPKPERFRKLFTREYTEKTAKVEEQNLFSLFRDQKSVHGQFVNMRGQENIQTVFHSGVLFDCSKGVGQIVFPRGSCTCFRVGTKYVMTALHSVTKIIESYVECRPVQEKPNKDEFVHFGHLSDHNVFVDFNFLIEDQPRPERNKFHFRRIHREEDIPFVDKETDTIVLELENEPNKILPMQFTFGIPFLDKPFHLITHSNGRPKEFDKVYKMVDLNDVQTKKDIKFLNSESSKFLADKGKSELMHPCEILPDDVLANKNRNLFHCASSKGASGSPGVQVTSAGQVFVVTMLLHGYPDWYYDPKCEDIKASWPKRYTIEQGVNFGSVYLKMNDINAPLCAEVFHVVDQLTDSTVHTVRAVQPTD